MGGLAADPPQPLSGLHGESFTADRPIGLNGDYAPAQLFCTGQPNASRPIEKAVDEF